MRINLILLSKLLLLGVLLVVVVVIRGLTTNVRAQVIEQQRSIERQPEELLQAVAARVDLDKRSFDIARLQAYVVPRERLIEVVNAIEAESNPRRVDVAVSDIRPEPTVNDEGKVVEPAGPLQPIRIRVTAYGQPADLIDFLYKTEHLPYLLQLQSWHLTTETKARRQPPPTAAEAGQPAVPESLLEAEVIVFVAKEEVDAES